MKGGAQRWVRCALSIAGVYGYFLIFAQFALVEIMRGAGVGGVAEKGYLGMMAVVGVIAGFWVGFRDRDWVGVIRVGMMMAGGAACLAVVGYGDWQWAVIAVMTGCGLGMATTGLAAWLPRVSSVWVAGLGTGLAYGLCNVPVFFTLVPQHQAVLGCAFALLAMVIPSEGKDEGRELEVRGGEDRQGRVFFPAVIVVMMALVWMDSAAFFVIQHSSDLKGGTWGDGDLWRNGLIHWLVAVLSGVALARGGVKWVMVGAWVVLSVAALGVNASETRGWAGCLYPAAVSMYSTVLIAWPGWLGQVGRTRDAARRAAWLFGVAGWIGSANGIGMAQSLQRVPEEFVVIAGVVCVLGLIGMDWRRWREMLGVAGVLLVVGVTWYFRDVGEERGRSEVERGRQVYVSEGCIHCHSQYQRPIRVDQGDWLLASDPRSTLKQVPVLIGNRRQGPDLAMVGIRRSSAWLEEHFKAPDAFASGTMMPSYRRLFEGTKGRDLVAYLASLGQDRAAEYQEKVFEWQLGQVEESQDGRGLYLQHCAVCHGERGWGDGQLSNRFRTKPANLVVGPFRWTGDAEGRDRQLARVIKFGIGGTDMPGHEVLRDSQVKGLVEELKRMRAKNKVEPGKGF